MLSLYFVPQYLKLPQISLFKSFFKGVGVLAPPPPPSNKGGPYWGGLRALVYIKMEGNERPLGWVTFQEAKITGADEDEWQRERIYNLKIKQSRALISKKCKN